MEEIKTLVQALAKRINFEMCLPEEIQCRKS